MQNEKLKIMLDAGANGLLSDIRQRVQKRGGTG